MFLHKSGFFCCMALAASLLDFSCALAYGKTVGIDRDCGQAGQISLAQASSIYEDLLIADAGKDDAAATFGGDLSDEGEKEYISQIITWLNTLSENQRNKAKIILQESHKEMRELRRDIYNKKLELASLRFKDDNSLKRLPELGLELQNLRIILREKLKLVNERLLKEAGIQTSQLVGEGFWLQPLIKKPKSGDKSGLKNPAPDTPVSMGIILYCRSPQ